MNATRKRRPLQPVHGTCRWVRRPGEPIDARSGICRINGSLYGVIFFPTCYEVKRIGGPIYHLPLDLSSCDCPDATFASARPGGCKHRKALAVLLRAIGM
jgi:hypothetical protein